jgi:hypothetical protein
MYGEYFLQQPEAVGTVGILRQRLGQMVDRVLWVSLNLKGAHGDLVLFLRRCGRRMAVLVARFGFALSAAPTK